ncbi:MAG: hypothetical protein J5680_03565, partial [Neisseriaceae bacterium]|nr:hypothetical protein [Neisseriaceae bacterium]
YPPVDNHSQLVTHRSGSLKRLFAPLTLSLFSILFIPYAQAATVCHTEHFQPIYCLKGTGLTQKSVSRTAKCRKVGRSVEVQVCREIHQRLPHGQELLERLKGQALRDEIITVEPSVWAEVKNNRDFIDTEIDRSQLNQSVHLGELGGSRLEINPSLQVSPKETIQPIQGGKLIKQETIKK